MQIIGVGALAKSAVDIPRDVNAAPGGGELGIRRRKSLLDKITPTQALENRVGWIRRRHRQGSFAGPAGKKYVV
jgi:hypothetical protein